MKKLKILFSFWILSLANLYGESKSVLGSWDFEEINNKDQLGHILNYKNTEQVKGFIRKGIKFNGKNSCVRISPDNNIDKIQDSFSVELWFKILGNSPEYKLTMSLINKNLTGDGNREPFHISIWCADADGTKVLPEGKTIWVRLADGNNKRNIELRPGGIVDDGKFHHVALVYNSEIKHVYLFLDGSIIADKSLPADWKPYQNKDDITLGLWPGYGDYFNGIIDEVKIYSRALTAEDVLSNYVSGIIPSVNTTSTPDFNIPVVNVPPLIDGFSSDAEWRNALLIEGFLKADGILSLRKARLHMKHDRNNLYITLTSSIIGNRLKADAKNNDEAVLLDDNIELAAITENGKDVKQIVFNSNGKMFDPDNKNSNCAGEIKTSSSIKEQKWIIEMSIPLKCFGITKYSGLNKFKLNITRNYITPPKDAFDVSVPEIMSDSLVEQSKKQSNYANITIRENAPAMEFKLGGMLETGSVSSELTINDDTAKMPLSYMLNLMQNEKIIQQEKGSTSDKNITCKIENKLNLKERLVLGILSARVDTLDCSTVIFNRVIPFIANNNLFDFDYIVRRQEKNLIIDLNKTIINAFSKERNIQLLITDAQGNNILKELVEKYDRKSKYVQIPVPLDKLPDMTALKIKVALLEPDSTVIFEKEKDFIKMENSEGVRCTIGEDDSVPPPWIPLDSQDDFSVKCWNREYAFGGTTILRQVTAGGQEILKSPVRFTIQQNGKVIDWTKPLMKYLSKGKDKTTIASESRAGNVKFSCRTTVEFDGMIRIDASVIPEKYEKLDAMTVDIPIKPEFAQYIYASLGENLGFNYFQGWERRIGKLNGNWHSEFLPFVWLGNEDKGIVWFAENNKGWINADPSREIEIISNAQETILRINYADSPFVLSAPFTFTFGIQATPTRPRPENWRKFRFGTFNDPEESSAIILGWTGPRPNSAKFWPLVFDPKMLQSEIRQAQKIGLDIPLIYTYPQVCDTACPEVRYFLEEWAREKSAGRARSYPTSINYKRVFECGFLSMASKEYQNFYIYNLYSLLKKCPELHGIYYDGAIVAKSNNPIQGCDYVKEGKECGTYPIFATREFYKRVYKMVKRLNKENIITAHISCTRGIPLESFFDLLVDGEHMGGALANKNYDYIDAIPLDVWRTQFTCKQVGGIPVFLPQLDRGFFKNGKDPKKMPVLYAQKTRSLLAMLLVHDIAPWNFLADGEEIKKYYKRLDEFGIVGSLFLPYWKNEDMVLTFDNNVI